MLLVVCVPPLGGGGGAGGNRTASKACMYVCIQEYDTSVPDGTVLMVLQKGYQAGDTLLRPALVKVSTC